MAVTSTLRDDHVRVVTMDYPPVNALPVQGWYDVARALDEASKDPATHVVILRAEGRGFNAGVDIKEMQHTTGFDALIGANKGCFAAFKSVYECSVPVIAAVNGFCLGGGVGLVGNADVRHRWTDKRGRALLSKENPDHAPWLPDAVRRVSGLPVWRRRAAPACPYSRRHIRPSAPRCQVQPRWSRCGRESRGRG